MKTAKNTNGSKKSHHLLVFALAAAVALIFGTWAYIYFYPTLIYNALEKTIVQNGLGSGFGIPVNTLYTMSNLASPSAAKSNVLIDGTNHDTLYTVGWLELGEKPQVLHVPDMDGRYYSIQFTDPTDGSVFAYVGRRTTGTEAGDYLVTDSSWSGLVPSNMKKISSPNIRVLIIGRVLVENDDDLTTAYNLSKQITLKPLEP